MSLCRLAHGRRGPAGGLPQRPDALAGERGAWTTPCLLNDVFSYQKEIEYEGEVHNGVLVVQNFFDCDYPTGARHRRRPDGRQRMRQFQHVVAHELPVLYDDFGLDEEARAALAGYVRELQNWMAGILVWHRDCLRYDEESLRRHHRPPRSRLIGPTGLGTSAALVV